MTTQTTLSRKPRTVAVIPARGGSKGIPLKNLQKIAGRSLLTRAIHAASAASSIDTVVVSTDHDAIAHEATLAGALVVRRPEDLASDIASSEDALLHTLDALEEDYEVLAFIQCTSPFIDPNSIDEAVRKVEEDQADSVFSAAIDHSFLWTRSEDGAALAVGHDATHRPRRQDRKVHYNETGAFYVMRTDGFRVARHRFFGRTRIQVVDDWQAQEIDTLNDLALVRAMANDIEKPSHLDVDALVTDFDGVHTDDSAYLSQDGEETVRVHRGDGLGIKELRRRGVPVLILSTEVNEVVRRRAEKLGVEVLHGIEDKASALRSWIEAKGLDAKRVAYVGNDVNDLPAFGVVGWPIAVPESHPLVDTASRFVLSRKGGHGAVREVCELVAAGYDLRTGATAPQTRAVPAPASADVFSIGHLVDA